MDVEVRKIDWLNIASLFHTLDGTFSADKGFEAFNVQEIGVATRIPDLCILMYGWASVRKSSFQLHKRYVLLLRDTLLYALSAEISRIPLKDFDRNFEKALIGQLISVYKKFVLEFPTVIKVCPDIFHAVHKLSKDPWQNTYCSWAKLCDGNMQICDAQVLAYFKSEPEEIVLARVHFLVLQNLWKPAGELAKLYFLYHSRIPKDKSCACKISERQDFLQEGCQIRSSAAAYWCAFIWKNTMDFREVSAILWKLECHEGIDIIHGLQRAAECPNICFGLVQLVIYKMFNSPGSSRLSEENCCIQELFRLFCVLLKEQKSSIEEVKVFVHKLIVQHAPTAAHLYSFADTLCKVHGKKFNSLFLELYIRALTSDMNFREYFLDAEGAKAEAERSSSLIHLTKVFEKLSMLFDGKQKEFERECVFTAFCLIPTQSRLDKLQSLTHQLLEDKYRFLRRTRKETNDCNCPTKCTGFCGSKLKSLHPLLDINIRGIPKELLTELIPIVDGLRPLYLRYNYFDWEENQAQLREYLEEYQKKNPVVEEPTPTVTKNRKRQSRKKIRSVVPSNKTGTHTIKTKSKKQNISEPSHVPKKVTMQMMASIDLKKNCLSPSASSKISPLSSTFKKNKHFNSQDKAPSRKKSNPQDKQISAEKSSTMPLTQRKLTRSSSAKSPIFAASSDSAKECVSNLSIDASVKRLTIRQHTRNGSTTANKEAAIPSHLSPFSVKSGESSTSASESSITSLEDARDTADDSPSIPILVKKPNVMQNVPMRPIIQCNEKSSAMSLPSLIYSDKNIGLNSSKSTETNSFIHNKAISFSQEKFISANSSTLVRSTVDEVPSINPLVNIPIIIEHTSGSSMISNEKSALILKDSSIASDVLSVTIDPGKEKNLNDPNESNFYLDMPYETPTKSEQKFIRTMVSRNKSELDNRPSRIQSNILKNNTIKTPCTVSSLSGNSKKIQVTKMKKLAITKTKNLKSNIALRNKPLYSSCTEAMSSTLCSDDIPKPPQSNQSKKVPSISSASPILVRKNVDAIHSINTSLKKTYAGEDICKRQKLNEKHPTISLASSTLVTNTISKQHNHENPMESSSEKSPSISSVLVGNNIIVNSLMHAKTSIPPDEKSFSKPITSSELVTNCVPENFLVDMFTKKPNILQGVCENQIPPSNEEFTIRSSRFGSQLTSSKTLASKRNINGQTKDVSSDWQQSIDKSAKYGHLTNIPSAIATCKRMCTPKTLNKEGAQLPKPLKSIEKNSKSGFQLTSDLLVPSSEIIKQGVTNESQLTSRAFLSSDIQNKQGSSDALQSNMTDTLTTVNQATKKFRTASKNVLVSFDVKELEQHIKSDESEFVLDVKDESFTALDYPVFGNILLRRIPQHTNHQPNIQSSVLHNDPIKVPCIISPCQDNNSKKLLFTKLNFSSINPSLELSINEGSDTSYLEPRCSNATQMPELQQVIPEISRSGSQLSNNLLFSSSNPDEQRSANDAVACVGQKADEMASNLMENNQKLEFTQFDRGTDISSTKASSIKKLSPTLCSGEIPTTSCRGVSQVPKFQESNQDTVMLNSLFASSGLLSPSDQNKQEITNNAGTFEDLQSNMADSIAAIHFSTYELRTKLKTVFVSFGASEINKLIDSNESEFLLDVNDKNFTMLNHAILANLVINFNPGNINQLSRIQSGVVKNDKIKIPCIISPLQGNTKKLVLTKINYTDNNCSMPLPVN